MRFLVLVVICSSAYAHTFAPAILDVSERAPGQFALRWTPSPTSPDARLGAELSDRCRVIDQMYQCEPLRAIAVTGELGVEVFVHVRFLDGREVSGMVTAGGDALRIETGAPMGQPRLQVIARYARLGIAHILSGWDHLLFVLALLFLVRGRRALIQAVSAFTVGHTLSLALATLQVVSVPSPPVEAAIALSLVLLALELVRPDGRPTLTRRRPFVIAFAFGLLHGLGFAGALAAIGLPPDRIPLALVSFNAGVEIGQLLIILAMLGPVLLLRKHTRAVAYAIGCISMMWMIERIGAFWG